MYHHFHSMCAECFVCKIEWIYSFFGTCILNYAEFCYCSWDFVEYTGNMHSYKSWFKFHSVVYKQHILLLSTFCIIFISMQMYFYVWFFWDSIMKWRGFINNNKKDNCDFLCLCIITEELCLQILTNTVVNEDRFTNFSCWNNGLY